MLELHHNVQRDRGGYFRAYVYEVYDRKFNRLAFVSDPSTYRHVSGIATKVIKSHLAVDASHCKPTNFGISVNRKMVAVVLYHTLRKSYRTIAYEVFDGTGPIVSVSKSKWCSTQGEAMKEGNILLHGAPDGVALGAWKSSLL